MKKHIRQYLIRWNLYSVSRIIYHASLMLYDRFIRSPYYYFFPNKGVDAYRKMQTIQYQLYTSSFDDAKNRCVGEFEKHESYPYENYLLEHYSGEQGSALDFACGIGRMMNRMLARFSHVDGIELNESNIEYAKEYLNDCGHETSRFSIFQTNGVAIPSIDRSYDFIYSTIALQHIAVYKIRYSIFSGLFDLLKKGGCCCFQVGFGWDNGVHWFDNCYIARSTNAGTDVSIPDATHLQAISDDFMKIGFVNIRFEYKLSPHPEQGNNYHPIWIFIHMERPF